MKSAGRKSTEKPGPNGPLQPNLQALVVNGTEVCFAAPLSKIPFASLPRAVEKPIHGPRRASQPSSQHRQRAIWRGISQWSPRKGDAGFSSLRDPAVNWGRSGAGGMGEASESAVGRDLKQMWWAVGRGGRGKHD